MKHFSPLWGSWACQTWTITLRSQRRGKMVASYWPVVGHVGSRKFPGQPAATVRPRSPQFMIILQPQLQPSLYPLPRKSNRSFGQPRRGTLTDTHWWVKVYMPKGQRRTRIWTSSFGQPGCRACLSSYKQCLKDMSLVVRAWQNMVHWRREWQTTSVFLTQEPHEHKEKSKRYDTGRWTSYVSSCQNVTKEGPKNSSDDDDDHFYGEEKEVGRIIVKSPWHFIFWIFARKEEESFCYCLRIWELPFLVSQF